MTYYKLAWKLPQRNRYVKVDNRNVYIYISKWNRWQKYGDLNNRTPEDAIVALFAPSIASFDGLYIKELPPERLAIELFYSLHT